jgi:glycosyltransferase involved in cell wall biosynthesis
MTNDKARLENDTLIVVASPYAAHPGHHWKYAEQIGLALLKERCRVAIIVHESTICPPAPELAHLIQTSSPLSRRIVRIALNFSWLAGARQALETFGVLMAISRTTTRRDRVVLHFVDATLLVFFFWEFFARRRCVYNLMGGPEPMVATNFLPNPGRWIKRNLTRWLLNASLKRGLLEFCAETETIKRQWMATLGAHVRCIPYGISPIFEPIPLARARTELGLKKDEMVLLLFGTQREGKDFATVIRAATQLSPPPFLLFAGKYLSGPVPSDLVRQMGFTNYQIHDRFVSEEETRTYFAACDVVMIPYAEGYVKGSAVLLEACQHLKPVIATNTGYLREFVQEHETGWLFESGDPDDLANRVHAVARLAPDERSALDARILATASLYSWPQVIQQYLALYETLHHRSNR